MDCSRRSIWLILALLVLGGVFLLSCRKELPLRPRTGGEADVSEDGRKEERLQMVEHTIFRRGVTDDLVLEAMRTVPRHLFIPEDGQESAYDDYPVPIGLGQTISQPYIVAYMTQLLDIKPGDRVLEIGTGSGYQAAVLAEITSEVYSIEIIEPLGEKARARFDETGYEEVTTRIGDGYYGWPEHAPFDAIIVTAAAGHVPPPLVEQLTTGGRIVIPVGKPYEVQILMRVIKRADGTVYSELLDPVRFVPMTGAVQTTDQQGAGS